MNFLGPCMIWLLGEHAYMDNFKTEKNTSEYFMTFYKACENEFDDSVLYRKSNMKYTYTDQWINLHKNIWLVVKMHFLNV